MFVRNRKVRLIFRSLGVIFILTGFMIAFIIAVNNWPKSDEPGLTFSMSCRDTRGGEECLIHMN